MKSSFQIRCIVLCSILVVGLSVLSARLVQIQLVDRRYSERSQRERHTTERLWAMRGSIVDRKEEVLAKSIPVSTVIVDRKIMMDPTQASRALAYQEASEEAGWAELDPVKQSRRVNMLRGEILSKESADVIVQKHLAYAVGILARALRVDRKELRDKIENTKGNWFPIAKDLPQDIGDQLADTISQLKVQGIVVEGSIKRWYTSPTQATHLVGFTDEVDEMDENGFPHTRMIGRFGVESSMDSFLAGRDGWREHYRDARGQLVPGPATGLKPPRAGLNVKLTIDMGIQAILEDELDAGLKEYMSKKGTAILMDPKTGEVIAMASRPNMNLNLLDNLEDDGVSVNYAIQTIYEPGSTIKIVAASGALNERLVTPLTSIFCYNGFYQGKGFTVRDDHPVGSLSVEGVLQKSNNNGAYSLGRQLGSKRFYDYLHNYGFGRRTGIQLSGESAGTARNTGNEADFSRACFGYATNVTPLQLACAYSVIAGDGKLRKPHIVKSLIANDGTVVEDYQPEVMGQVLSARTAKQMRAALEKVVETGGTATRAAVDGYRVAGKTGTVQKHNPRGGYYTDRKIASFAGMMPAEDPAFVCVVVIDDPRNPEIKAQGGLVAAPIFSKIATRVAAHMNLQPTEPLSSPPVAATR